jgi:hypothetical protein
MAFPVTPRCPSPCRGRQRDALLQAGCALPSGRAKPPRSSNAARQPEWSDCETQDFGLLQTMVGAVMDASAEVEPDLWRRYFRIALQGLRPAGAPLEPLPVPPLPPEQMEGLLVGLVEAAQRVNDHERFATSG